MNLKKRLTPKALALGPYLIWMILFTIVPIVIVALYSVKTNTSSFTFANFARVFEPLYLQVILRSFELALVATIVCILMGYPAAYFIARGNPSKQFILILLFIVPMWMNFLARTYSWMSLLEKNGLINQFLGLFGIEPLNMMYTSGAVVLGMVYNYLPFMVFPIYSSLHKLDYSLIEASMDLGANPAQTFIKVTLPLSIPGIISGVTMVFMPCVTTFVVSQLLGGGQFTLIGNLIENQFTKVYDWGFGSALSIILMILMLISMGIVNRVGGTKEEGGMLL